MDKLYYFLLKYTLSSVDTLFIDNFKRQSRTSLRYGNLKGKDY